MRLRKCKADQQRDTRRKSARRSLASPTTAATSSPGSPPPPPSRRPRSPPAPAQPEQDCSLSALRALSLPIYERYAAQRKGRTPFTCASCDNNKQLTRAGLAQHLRTKHRGNGSNARVACHICGEEFDRADTAVEHNSAYHKIYDCLRCDEAFSELDRLKAHLRVAHDADWPWVCGFCDQTLLYELEFRLHVRGHTDKAPHVCPLCPDQDEDDDKRSFEDVALLCDHVADVHMTRSDDSNTSGEIMTESTASTNSATGKRGGKDKTSSASATTAATSADNADNSTSSPRDENAVNREIAALLLNLHASRSGDGNTQTQQQNRAEDLSLRNGGDTAMDLSKTKSEFSVPLPPSAKSGASSLELSKSFGLQNAAMGNPYSFYPSLAAASMSSLAGLNPNYLLQNLLLGKIQQIACSTSSSSSTSAGPLSFPTQPIPAQSLTLPVSASASLKPPASVLKSALPPSSSSSLTTTTSSSTSSPLPSLPTIPTLGMDGGGATSGNIPLLCGQIVAQLNGLLFLVHGLKNTQVELSLQTQLGAIYCRLQEIVSMVEQTKKIEAVAAAASADSSSAAAAINSLNKKQSKDARQKEDEKIAKQLQDYQRALLQQHGDKSSNQLVLAAAAQLKEAAAAAAAAMAGNGGASATDMVSLLKKQVQESGFGGESGSEDQHVEVESTSAASRRRRGRPPKNSGSDFSPSGKRSRSASCNANGDLQQHASSANTSGSSLMGGEGMMLQPHADGKSSGGKGIRNRVFCGECSGCLKNDDCGRCRYCKDKTKFGGQNRLRQKCLHRRCQMDTHRRRSSYANGGAANNASAEGVNEAGSSEMAAAVAAAHAAAYKSQTSRQSDSPDAIYSGVDLARLAAAAAAAAAANTCTKAEEKNNAEHKSSKSDGEHATRRSTRNRQKSADSSQANGGGGAGSGLSDDDSEEHRLGRSQSRIDKWKAKHEAMLKMASSADEMDDVEESKDKEEEVPAADPDEVALKPKGKKKRKSDEEVGDSGNSEKKLKEEENEEEKPDEPLIDVVDAAEDTKPVAKEDSAGEDDHHEDVDEAAPELPSLEPNGVCIDLDVTSGRKSKLHRRHADAASQQQALSV